MAGKKKAPAKKAKKASASPSDQQSKKASAKKKDEATKDVVADTKSDNSNENLEVVDEVPSKEEIRELEEAEQDDASTEENLDVVDEKPTGQDLVELEMAVQDDISENEGLDIVDETPTEKEMKELEEDEKVERINSIRTPKETVDNNKQEAADEVVAPKDSVYKEITLKGLSGTVTLQQELLVFKSDSTEKKATKRLYYEQISKHQGNPPKQKKVLLKLIMKDDSNIILELKDRDIMKELRTELSSRMDTFVAALAEAKEQGSGNENDSKAKKNTKSDSGEAPNQNEDKVEPKVVNDKPADAPKKKKDEISISEEAEVKKSKSGKTAEGIETPKQPTKEAPDADGESIAAKESENDSKAKNNTKTDSDEAPSQSKDNNTEPEEVVNDKPADAPKKEADEISSSEAVEENDSKTKINTKTDSVEAPSQNKDNNVELEEVVNDKPADAPKKKEEEISNSEEPEVKKPKSEKTAEDIETPEQPTKEATDVGGESVTAKESDFTPIVFKNVQIQGKTGSLSYLQHEVMFQKDGEDSAHTTIPYKNISKHQASPPKIPKAMLKLVLTEGKPVTFQFSDREELKQAHKDLTAAIKHYEETRMSPPSTTGSSVESTSNNPDETASKSVEDTSATKATDESAQSTDTTNSTVKKDNEVPLEESKADATNKSEETAEDMDVSKAIDNNDQLIAATEVAKEESTPADDLENSLQPPGKSEVEKKTPIQVKEDGSAGKASINDTEILEVPEKGEMKEEGAEAAHTGDSDARTKPVSDEKSPVGTDQEAKTPEIDGMPNEEEVASVEQDTNDRDEPESDVEDETEPREAEVEEDEFQRDDDDEGEDESGGPVGGDIKAPPEDNESQNIEVHHHHHLVEEDLGIIEVMGPEDPHPEETQGSSLLGTEDLDDDEEEDEEVLANTPKQRSKRASLLEHNEAERTKRLENSFSESGGDWEDDDNWEESEIAFFDDDDDGVISNQYEEEESIALLLGGGDSVSHDSQGDSETTLSLPGEDGSISSSNSGSSSDSDSSTASFADGSESSSERSSSSSRSSSSEAQESSESSSEEDLANDEYYDPANAWLSYTETQDDDVLPEVAPRALRIRKKTFKRSESDSDSEEYSSEEESEDESRSSSEGTDNGDMSAEGFRSVEDFDEENRLSAKKDPKHFYDWSKEKVVNGAMRDKDTFFDWKKHSKASKPKADNAPPPPPPPASPSTPPPDNRENDTPPPPPSPPSTPPPDNKENVSPPSPATTASLPTNEDDSVVEKWTIRASNDPERRYFNWKGFAKDKRPLPPAFDWKKHARVQRRRSKKQKTSNDKDQGPSPNAPGTPNKDISNGIDLLKKLMSTGDDKARASLLSQHIAPAAQGQSHPHVSPDELLRAIAKFVEMIRAVKKTDDCPEILAARHVAIVARLAIIKLYGEDSEVLRTFELGLVPAFAPQAAKQAET